MSFPEHHAARRTRVALFDPRHTICWWHHPSGERYETYNRLGALSPESNEPLQHLVDTVLETIIEVTYGKADHPDIDERPYSSHAIVTKAMPGFRDPEVVEERTHWTAFTTREFLPDPVAIKACRLSITKALAIETPVLLEAAQELLPNHEPKEVSDAVLACGQLVVPGLYDSRFVWQPHRLLALSPAG